MEVTVNNKLSEEFLRERNGIYEPDAKVWEPESSAFAKDENFLPVIDLAENKDSAKSYPSKRLFIVLSVLCALCAVLAAVFSDRIFTFENTDRVTDFLKVHIDGDFFANASATFIATALWCTLTFLAGFFAYARPLAAIIPMLYCTGAGIGFYEFTAVYGAGGAAAFAAFCLVRVILTALVLCYVCVNSFEASAKLAAAIKGKDAKGLPQCFKKHTVKFIFAVICSFVIGIADAACSLVAGNYFIL